LGLQKTIPKFELICNREFILTIKRLHYLNSGLNIKLDSVFTLIRRKNKDSLISLIDVDDRINIIKKKFLLLI
jgi:hypothetical protein